MFQGRKYTFRSQNGKDNEWKINAVLPWRHYEVVSLKTNQLFNDRNNLLYTCDKDSKKLKSDMGTYALERCNMVEGEIF